MNNYLKLIIGCLILFVMVSCGGKVSSNLNTTLENARNTETRTAPTEAQYRNNILGILTSVDSLQTKKEKLLSSIVPDEYRSFHLSLLLGITDFQMKKNKDNLLTIGQSNTWVAGAINNLQ